MNNTKRERIWSEKYARDSVTDTEVRDIAAAIGASPIFAILLHNRGYRSADEAMRFLRFETSDFHDPFLLNDIDRAVERIRLAVANKEKICIYGDYDVDGVTSVSMLYLYLTGMGADVTIKIPKRDCEGYGMSSAAVDALAEAGVSLIVTVDTGITANEEIQHARELGVDVVVTDHHECHTELPEACAVVNPHRPDSTYPFSELAGVGVVFKLICAYEMTLCRERGESVLDGVSRICKKYADLAAIGTVADVMPITDENRLIVSMGLAQLENSPRIGVAALMDAANITQKDGKPVKKRKITSGTIGFGLAPRINAAGRISDSIIAVNLLLSDNEADAEAYAEELCIINKRRQVEENQIAEQAYYYDTHHYAVFDILGHGIGRYHPAVLSQLVLQVIECPLALLGVFALHLPDEKRVGNLVAVVLERFHLANLAMQVLRNLHRVMLYGLVAVESQADELVVLAQNLRRRA